MKIAQHNSSHRTHRSVIGLLTYLARNMNTKEAHKEAIMQIERYLAGTVHKGLVFTPDKELFSSLQFWVDANFEGITPQKQSTMLIQ